MDWIIVLTLAILLLATNCFWALITHKMINKHMSRDFWSYQATKQVPKDKKIELAEALKNVKIPTQTGPNEIDTLDEMIKQAMPFG